MTAASVPLRFWIDLSLECIRRDHTAPGPGDQKGPFQTARTLGMALAALNDGHAIASGRAPLLKVPATAGLAGLTGHQINIASGAACAQVLKLRYPKQASLLDPSWLCWLENFGYGPVDSPAEIAGRAFGTAIHNLGRNDASNAAPGRYSPSGLPYGHTAPPNEPQQGYAGADWGFSTPLLASRVADFPPPPGRKSATEVTPTPHYRDDFAKTRDFGRLNSTTRSKEQEFVGIAWGYDGPKEIGTPPRLYLQVVLSVLDAIQAQRPDKLSVADELTILAGVGIAMADAGIDAWYYKYAPTHMMWRPVVGIRKAIDGNGTADPNFFPLGRPDTNGRGLALTPDFPAYPSGHATFGAAAFQLLRLFLVQKGFTTFDEYGVDNICIEFVSDEYNGVNKDPRTLKPRERQPVVLPSLWKAITDNSVSRVYLGVHWQFDGITKRNIANTEDEFGVPHSPSELGKTGGVWLGAQIANKIAPSLGVTAATICASKIS
jgi:membrane-associated phospholipid phosphatase